MMTKKDFEAIASAMGRTAGRVRRIYGNDHPAGDAVCVAQVEVMLAVGNACSVANPRFDRERFEAAYDAALLEANNA